jgi:hypothetical protein
VAKLTNLKHSYTVLLALCVGIACWFLEKSERGISESWVARPFENGSAAQCRFRLLYYPWKDGYQSVFVLSFIHFHLLLWERNLWYIPGSLLV